MMRINLEMFWLLPTASGTNAICFVFLGVVKLQSHLSSQTSIDDAYPELPNSKTLPRMKSLRIAIFVGLLRFPAN